MAGHVGVDVARAHSIDLHILALDGLEVSEDFGIVVDAHLRDSIDALGESFFLIVIFLNSLDEVINDIEQFSLSQFGASQFIFNVIVSDSGEFSDHRSDKDDLA